MTRGAKIEAATIMFAVVVELFAGYGIGKAYGVFIVACALFVGSRAGKWTNGDTNGK